MLLTPFGSLAWTIEDACLPCSTSLLNASMLARRELAGAASVPALGYPRPRASSGGAGWMRTLGHSSTFQLLGVHEGLSVTHRSM